MEKCDTKSCMCWMHVIIAVLVIGAVVFAFARVGCNNNNERDTITSSGTAYKDVEPNEVEISFAVETKSATASEAQKDNAGISDAVKKNLLDLGIAEKDIETAGFNVWPEYSYEKETGKPIFLDYKVSHSITVKSNDIKSSGKFLDAITGSGVNNINYISFGLDEEKQLEARNELMAEAAKNARDKADIMAAGTGVKIKGVHSVSEGGFDYPVVRMSKDNLMAMEAGTSETSVNPGQVKVTTSVNVVYLIR